MANGNALAPAFAIALWLLLPASGTAEQCAHPEGRYGCFTTVQAALDAAGPGETVRALPGIYRELVGVRKPGIKLVGRPNAPSLVRIDALGLGDTGSGLGIGADDVKVTGITISNAPNWGIGIGAFRKNIRLDRIRLAMAGLEDRESSCILFEEGVDNIVIENSEISGCIPTGINLLSGDPIIGKITFRNNTF